MRRRNSKAQRRRGFSTIVTSVMLITAVAIMGSFLVSWSSSAFTTQRVNVSNEVNNRVNQINESFIIEDVWFYGGNDMKVTVRNTGEVTMNVTHIYVNNTLASTPNQIVSIGNYTQITVENFATYGSGSAQNIWVHTKVGTDVKQTWKS